METSVATIEPSEVYDLVLQVSSMGSSIPDPAYHRIFSVCEWKNMQELPYRQVYDLRCLHIQRCSFPILTHETFEALISFIGTRSVLEVGAGSGYLSYHLAKCCNVVAVDSYETEYGMGSETGRSHFPKSSQVIEGNALDYVSKNYDIVISSWPDYNTQFAKNVVDKMSSGQIFIYQGEGWGGCTGSDAFHDTLDLDFTELTDVSDLLNENHIRFPGIHDSWMVYVKN